MILDGVYNDIKDDAGFLAECEQGRDLGFDGKTLIHPSQVDPCNATFAPTAEEVEKASRIIAAFEEAEAEGRGVVTVDGRMVENLHVEQARRTLAIERGDRRPQLRLACRKPTVWAQARRRRWPRRRPRGGCR